MLRTRRPSRRDEPVMEALLNVVHGALLEVDGIRGEEAHPRDCLVDGRFVTASDGLQNVAHKELTHAIDIRLSHRTVFFQLLSVCIAGAAVRYSVAVQHVAFAEDPMTQDAEASPVSGLQGITALRTLRGSVNFPHETFSASWRLCVTAPLCALEYLKSPMNAELNDTAVQRGAQMARSMTAVCQSLHGQKLAATPAAAAPATQLGNVVPKGGKTPADAR